MLFPRDSGVFKCIFMVDEGLVCHLWKYGQMNYFFDPRKTATERKGCKIQGVASSLSELSCGLSILLLPRMHAKSLRLTTFYYLCFCYSTLFLRQVGKLCLKTVFKPWTSRLYIFNEYWTHSTTVRCCLGLGLLDTVLKSIIITRFVMGHMPLYTKISVILIELLFQRKSINSKLALEYF